FVEIPYVGHPRCLASGSAEEIRSDQYGRSSRPQNHACTVERLAGPVTGHKPGEILDVLPLDDDHRIQAAALHFALHALVTRDVLRRRKVRKLWRNDTVHNHGRFPLIYIRLTGRYMAYG